MKWNHYFAAVLIGSLLFLSVGAPPFSVLTAAGAVAIINLFRMRRIRQ